MQYVIYMIDQSDLLLFYNHLQVCVIEVKQSFCTFVPLYCSSKFELTTFLQFRISFMRVSLKRRRHVVVTAIWCCCWLLHVFYICNISCEYIALSISSYVLFHHFSSLVKCIISFVGKCVFRLRKPRVIHLKSQCNNLCEKSRNKWWFMKI